jgi:hypothetical protein
MREHDEEHMGIQSELGTHGRHESCHMTMT